MTMAWIYSHVRWVAPLCTAGILIGAARADKVRPPPRPKFVTQPDYWPRLQPRGKTYRVPGDSVVLEKHATIFHWQLELPDGGGLAVGGLSTRTDDPRPPTMVKRDGKWISLRDELRKNNALQPHHARLAELRRPLMRIASLARHIYLEGRSETAEKAYLDAEVAPQIVTATAKLRAARAALVESRTGADPYSAEQLAFALGHLDKIPPALSALGTRTSHEKLAALRHARMHLEQATEALDAEPPARAFSMPAYDAKTGLFVLFGGDHFDYLSNDLWVFDPRAQRWRQRHPSPSPEPRADHAFESDQPGMLKLRGGLIYHRPMDGWGDYPYVHAGVGDWTYDVAANAWSGPAEAEGLPADTRHYRVISYVPDHFTTGPRPDAAAHGKVLAELPTNTWVELQPPLRFAWHRDWGTLAFDADRDLIYWYNGGHSSYSGADVVHYHIATNRWDQLVETEFATGQIGGGESVPGWNFNRRPWIPGHSYNSYSYHPGLKKMLVNGRQGLSNQHFDQHTYVYDPDEGDWTERVKTPRSFDVFSTQVRWIPKFGMVTWYGDQLWKLNDRSLDWELLKIKGALPQARCDFSGMVYDPPRNRQLMFSGGDYQGTPYSGEVGVFSPDLMEATSFTPEGAEHIGALHAGKENAHSVWVLREVVYHPGADLFLFGSQLPGGYMAALDVKGNRWIGLKLPGRWPWGLSAGLAYDPQRDLLFATGTVGEVSALRLDPKTLTVKSFAEIVGEK